MTDTDYLAALRDKLNRQRTPNKLSIGDRIEWQGGTRTITARTVTAAYASLTFADGDEWRGEPDELFYLAT